VARATEEIRAERDRVLRELSTQVGQIAVELAGRVVEKELDKTTQQQLVDEFIEQVSGSGNGKP
jgi:F-type H+-transporting ATPase subunit b